MLFLFNFHLKSAGSRIGLIERFNMNDILIYDYYRFSSLNAFKNIVHAKYKHSKAYEMTCILGHRL